MHEKVLAGPTVLVLKYDPHNRFTGCFQSCTAVCSSTSSLRQNINIDVNNPISIAYGQNQSQSLRQNQNIGQIQLQNKANVALPKVGTAGSVLNSSNVKSFAAKPNTQAAEGHSDWIKASEAKESNVQGHTGFAPGSCYTVAKRVCQKACAKPHDHMLKTCSELCNGMDVED